MQGKAWDEKDQNHNQGCTDGSRNSQEGEWRGVISGVIIEMNILVDWTES